MAQQLLAVQEKMLSMLDAQRATMKEQVSLIQSMNAVLSEKPKEGGGVLSQLQDIQKSLEEAGKSSETFEEKLSKAAKDSITPIDGLTSSASKTAGSLSTLKKAAPIAFFAGMGDAVKMIGKKMAIIGEMATSWLSLFSQIAMSAVSIAEAVISIPFRIFSGMIKLASALAVEYKHIAEAFESFRGQFGAFYNETGRALKEGLASAKQMAKLAGLGYYSVFRDTAEAIKFFQDTFENFGALMDTVGREIGKAGDRFVHFAKGMGLSGEQLKTTASVAKTFGRSMMDVLGDVANQTLQLAETFDISNKSLARDVVSMMADVKTFGNASVKSLTATAVRVRSLGVEVKSLAGVVDKFLNFEDAARNASMLSQSFGVNLDALGLMNSAAKDQAGLLDKLRNSMFAAGRDASKMSTAELRLLSQTVGLSEEEARLAFSMKNRGKSLEEIKKQADKAGKKELTQAEAMSKLADAVERVIRVFQYESFFGAFFQGFSRGVKLAAPFINTLMDLQGALDQTRMAGQEVGRAFVSSFPGVLKMLKALSDTFNPENFKHVREALTDAFSKLFDDLKTLDAVSAMSSFWDNLTGAFRIVSNKQSEKMWGPLKDGFLDFLAGFGKIIAGSIPLIREKVTKAMTFFTGVLVDGLETQLKKMNGTSDGTAGKVWDVFLGPIWKALGDAWNNPEFQTALSDLETALIQKLEDTVVSAAKYLVQHPVASLAIVGALSAIFLGPAIVTGLASAAGSLGGMLLGTLASAVTVSAGALPAIIVGGLALALIEAITLAFTAVTGSIAVSRGISKFNDDFALQFKNDASSKLGSAVAGIVDTFTFGLFTDEQAADVGERAATFRETILKKIRSVPFVGSLIADSADELTSSILNLIGSFGDNIMDVLTKGSLDTSHVKAFGKSISKQLILLFKFLNTTLPKIVKGAFLLFGAAVIREIPTIMSTFLKVESVILSFLSGLVEDIPFIGKPLAYLLDFGSYAATKIGEFWDFVQVKWSSLVDTIVQAWSDGNLSGLVTKTLSDVAVYVVTSISNITSSIKDGLKTGLAEVPKLLKQPFENGISDIKDYLGIKSPSKMFRSDIGLNMAAGLTQGLTIGLANLPETVASSIGGTDIVSKVTGDAAEALHKIASQITEINQSIASIPDIDVPLKLEKIGKILGIKDDVLRIETKPVNITLNLNITIEADKLSQVLLDTGKIMPK